MKKKLVAHSKIGMIMRLCIIFMVVLQFATFANGSAQDQRINLDLKQVSYYELFNEIHKQTGLRFIYNTNQLENMDPVSIQAENIKVQDVLSEVLNNTPFTFEYDKKVITLLRRMDDQKKSLKITGKVVDAQKAPLPGVTVKLVGTNLGTATNAEGIFAMELPMEEGQLELSFIGFKKQIVAFTEKNVREPLFIIMEEEIQAIEEVVVTGYGNITKGNYTGAATTVKGEDVLMAGVATIDQMLQGVIPGMLVTNTSGQVGSTPKIRVRGTSSLLGSQEPVWVVDGVIQRDPRPFNSEENTKFSVDADDITELAGNAISWLNPNDIETITVLKDASATAIYGSQAANGVIVITTKKANVGKISVNYSGDFTIGQRPRYGLYNLMNSKELIEFHDQMYRERRKFANGHVIEHSYQTLVEKLWTREITLQEMTESLRKLASYNTDWFDILFRNSFNHSHSLSVSGGTDKLQNRTSFSFNEQKGEAKGNNLNSFTVVSNTTARLWNCVTLNMNLKGSVRNVEGFAYGTDPFNYAYKMARTIPAYNEDGSLFFHKKEGLPSKLPVDNSLYNYNILHELANTGSESHTNSWGATFDLRWKILPGLEYQGLFSYNSSSEESQEHATEHAFHITSIRGYEYGEIETGSKEETYSPLPMGGVLATEGNSINSVTTRNSLIFDRMFKDKHRLTVQLGIETNSVKTTGTSNTRYGYMPDKGKTFVIPPYYYYNYLGEEFDNTTYCIGTRSDIDRQNNELSEYGSLVYTFNDRYVLNASGRVDASNRFGQDKNKRFEPTWSIGAKWRATQENFLQGKWWLNNLDLYASFGYQGNAVTTVSPELIGQHQYIDAYKNFGYSISSLPYPDLGWEKTKTWNIGLDAAFLNGRLNFSFNYFKKNGDVLSSKGVAIENGVSNSVITGTEMENTGYDFVINVVPVKTKDFTWQLSLNTAVTKNKISNNNRINTLNDYLTGAAIQSESSFSSFYSFDMIGLNPETGAPMFNMFDNLSGEEEEKYTTPLAFLVKSGSFTPDFSGGFNMSFKYKNWTLYTLFAVQWGGHNRVPNPYPIATSGGVVGPEYNVSRRVMNRWRNPGDELTTDIPSLPLSKGDAISIPETYTTYSSLMQRYTMYGYSSALVANTDFIRCRSLSLTYEMNKKALEKIGVQRMQLKASMTNPFMWVRDSKWDGLDPETANWPARRTTSLSLQVMF